MDGVGAWALTPSVACQVHGIKGISLAPDWRHANGRGLYLDDVALVLLAEPADGVPIAAIGGTPDPLMKIVGRGFVNAPGSGRPESENFHAGLRQATLRTLTDRACAKAYRHQRGNGGERFDWRRMICGIDPDGARAAQLGLQRRQRRAADGGHVRGAIEAAPDRAQPLEGCRTRPLWTSGRAGRHGPGRRVRLPRVHAWPGGVRD